MSNLKNNWLEDLSRQPITVGTPPIYLFNAAGHKLDQGMLMLSAQLRIASALEQKQWLQVAEMLPLTNMWVLVTTDPRFEPVPIITAGLSPDGTWVDYDGNAIETPLAWMYLPAAAHRPAPNADGHE